MLSQKKPDAMHLKRLIVHRYAGTAQIILPLDCLLFIPDTMAAAPGQVLAEVITGFYTGTLSPGGLSSPGSCVIYEYQTRQGLASVWHYRTKGAEVFRFFQTGVPPQQLTQLASTHVSWDQFWKKNKAPAYIVHTSAEYKAVLTGTASEPEAAPFKAYALDPGKHAAMLALFRPAWQYPPHTDLRAIRRYIGLSIGLGGPDLRIVRRYLEAFRVGYQNLQTLHTAVPAIRDLQQLQEQQNHLTRQQGRAIRALRLRAAHLQQEVSVYGQRIRTLRISQAHLTQQLSQTDQAFEAITQTTLAQIHCLETLITAQASAAQSQTEIPQAVVSFDPARIAAAIADWQHSLDQLLSAYTRHTPTQRDHTPDNTWNLLMQVWDEKATVMAERKLTHYRLTRAEAEEKLAREQVMMQAEHEEKKLREQIEQLSRQVEETDRRLKNAQQALARWLDDKYPDWQETIGKVVRPEVLEHPYLSPQIDRLNDLLFGVRLDLSELEVEIQTPAWLLQSKKELETSLTTARQALAQAQAGREKQLTALDRKFRQRSIEDQKILQQLDTETVRLEHSLRLLGQQMARSQYEFQAREEMQRVQYHTELHQLREQEALRRAAVNDALSGTGLDTPLTIATPDLDTVLLPLIQHADTRQLHLWKNLRDTLAHQRVKDQETWQRERTSQVAQLTAIESELEQLQARIQEAEALLASADSVLLATDRPDTFSHEPEDETETPAALELLISQIQVWHTELQISAQAITIQVRQLISSLHQDHLPDWQRDMSLSDQLSWLMTWGTEAGILMFQQRLAERYATLIGKITEETRALHGIEQHTGLVSRIAAWQEACDSVFNHADIRISVQLTPSDHPVVKTLLAIGRFFEQHPLTLGERSLFNQQVPDQANEESLRLLAALAGWLDTCEGNQLEPEDLWGIDIQWRMAQSVIEPAALQALLPVLLHYSSADSWSWPCRLSADVPPRVILQLREWLVRVHATSLLTGPALLAPLLAAETRFVAGSSEGMSVPRPLIRDAAVLHAG
ncbi:MAG: hypothetical protein SF053_06830 [Bacteroidia bacterium]|nr:hypothetical protein [Bacteroidia bacterium]